MSGQEKFNSIIDILDVLEIFKERDIEILQLRSVIRKLTMQLNEKDKVIKEFKEKLSTLDKDKNKNR